MTMPNNQIPRDLFEERIIKGMLGPGSDTYGLPDEEEIISDYPLKRYFTGILFPEKTKKESKEGFDTNDEQVDDSEENENTELEENLLSEDNEESTPNEKIVPDNDDEGIISQNSFHPTNIALTICVDQSINDLNVEFSFGIYHQPKQSDIKIKVPNSTYYELTDEKYGLPSSIRDKLRHDETNSYLYLTKELDGHKGGQVKRSGEYIEFDEYKKSEKYKDSSAKHHIEYFDKLIGRVWKRENIKISANIKIQDTDKPVVIKIEDHNIIEAGYNVKVYQTDKNPDKKYVKIQLVNLAKHNDKKYSNANEKLNQIGLFQAKIKISAQLEPYKTQQDMHPFDEEGQVLNMLYRNIESYGIGHNCSVIWDTKNPKPDSIETTFIPEYETKEIKNKFDKNDFDNDNDYQVMEDALDIRGLSVFGESKQSIINKLEKFISIYSKWINKQKRERESIPVQYKDISGKIKDNLDYNYERLSQNIRQLNDDKIFRAFQFTNTAMLVQIIISGDEDFAKKEKELSEVNQSIDYKSLDFFKNYDYSKINVPKYRPFQLAFLLLNIDSITDKESQSRKEIVDLLWFPTGGGKTEAYLAVAAFTIVWRRLNNETGYDGVTVIMRYTLRLLTSQQFERASRLIAVLEFLRLNYEHELKKESITIGLWIGSSSTPNDVKTAKSAIENIIKDTNNPESKNVFQITACPWCGTKLISKNESNKNGWECGFEESRGSIKIKCLNKKCVYHKELPVQVVDEILYKNPPTLLFATVDKFAMLAWKQEGHKFFSSLESDKSLPPDLII